MKKVFYTIILLSGLAVTVNAQSDKITAILDKEPANNATELNTNAAATAQLGEQGIVNMLTMLQPNGAADNTKIYDAISGFSFYTTQPGKEAWRTMATKAYCTALPKITDPYNEAFVISQLQIVGKDDAVATLKKYLGDKRLCDPAARALIKVGTPAAKMALRQALPASKDSCRLSIVEALGDSRDALAVKAISAIMGKDNNTDKVALYALAHIASPVSAKMMANAAQKAAFTYDVTNATSSYLLYIRNLGKKNAITAVGLAKTLNSKAGQANQVQTATAALKVIVDMQGAKSVPLLIAAARNSNQQYRDAALKFAGPYLLAATNGQWITEMSKAEAPEKAAIITMLGNNHVQAALPSVLNGLKNTDKGVVLASIKASQQIGQDKALSDLLAVLKTGDADEITAVQNALMVMKGPGVVAQVAKALPDAPAQAQPALIAVLAERKAHSQINIVTPLLNSSDPNVRAAAYASLAQLSGPDNLDQLFSLLASSDKPTETTNLQSAIISAVGQASDKSAQSAAVLAQMDKQSADKKPLYFNILAAIGDKASLSAVSKAYDSGDAAAQKTAVTALAQWSNMSAAPKLLAVSKTSADAGVQDQALKGYVAMISKSSYPDDEKVIYLRDAMDAAQKVSQKRMILEDISNDKTFPALVFVSKYLDDPQLQDVAADDVSNIALSSKDFYGENVKLWLNKALQIKKGGDSDYEKVAIRKFIAEMPNDPGLVPLFNNTDLTGWKGLVGNPLTRAKMDPQTLAKEQQKADSIMRKGWYVENGVLNFGGEGENICTTKQYRNFEMYVDWKIGPKGDAGIYLRGSPQVQIWDTSRVDVGAQVGSGGLYNNKTHESKPLKLADNAIGDWNTFHIIMKGDKVTVYFNGVLVVDNTVLDNYWNYNQPIFPKEQIELQAHGTHVYYRDIYLRELPD
ncbi:MAG TPA: family 16 glycoside hydrolase [Mucilaginibacter sp.]|jgi:HEAT repeat protein|nr:family 16 glycoside hydrolase [Mucilaginibacter sp.]